ncbi:MAG: iron-containing alcohol dehydrogenase, partial [Caulobacteraceae bacterium]
MQPFTYVGAPSRVVFGFGVLDRVPDEVKALGCRRALVLSTPQQAEAGQDLADRLGPSSAGLFSEAAMHTPVEITERAMAVVRQVGAD